MARTSLSSRGRKPVNEKGRVRTQEGIKKSLINIDFQVPRVVLRVGEEFYSLESVLRRL